MHSILFGLRIKDLGFRNYILYFIDKYAALSRLKIILDSKFYILDPARLPKGAR